MVENLYSTQIGNRITLPEHFDVPVVLEDIRSLGVDGGSYECRVRLLDGALEEAVISAEEVETIFGAKTVAADEKSTRP